jgi:hypothetical protein
MQPCLLVHRAYASPLQLSDPSLHIPAVAKGSGYASPGKRHSIRGTRCHAALGLTSGKIFRRFDWTVLWKRWPCAWCPHWTGSAVRPGLRIWQRHAWSRWRLHGGSGDHLISSAPRSSLTCPSIGRHET